MHFYLCTKIKKMPPPPNKIRYWFADKLRAWNLLIEKCSQFLLNWFSIYFCQTFSLHNYFTQTTTQMPAPPSPNQTNKHQRAWHATCVAGQILRLGWKVQKMKTQKSQVTTNSLLIENYHKTLHLKQKVKQFISKTNQGSSPAGRISHTFKTRCSALNFLRLWQIAPPKMIVTGKSPIGI